MSGAVAIRRQKRHILTWRCTRPLGMFFLVISGGRGRRIMENERKGEGCESVVGELMDLRRLSLFYVRVNGGHNCPLQLLLRPPYVASCQEGQAEAQQDVCGICSK